MIAAISILGPLIAEKLVDFDSEHAVLAGLGVLFLGGAGFWATAAAYIGRNLKQDKRGAT